VATNTRDPVLDEVDEIIPPEVRARNPNIQCVWSAAEDVLVGAGYTEFKGWAEQGDKEGKGGSDLSRVQMALDAKGIGYKAQRQRDTSIFDYARQEGVGVYCQVPGHALVCVALTDRYAYVINNYTSEERSKHVEKWPRSKFMNEWTGCSFCPLHRKRPRPDAPKVPETKPTTPVAPTTPVIQPGPKGDTGPAGPPGKDGASIDTTALVNQIAAMVDGKLAPQQAAINDLNNRLKYIESQQVKTRIEQVSRNP
jgi:hypothetical protein